MHSVLFSQFVSLDLQCQKKRIQRGFDNGWEMNREIKETSAESKLFESLFYR